MRSYRRRGRCKNLLFFSFLMKLKLLQLRKDQREKGGCVIVVIVDFHSSRRHRATTLQHNHWAMHLRATKSNSRKKSNKCNNQTYNLVEVASKCHNAYGQKGSLQMNVCRKVHCKCTFRDHSEITIRTPRETTHSETTQRYHSEH